MNEETLFHKALAQGDPQQRAAFLAAACAGKPDLRAAVEKLLAAHEQPGSFLARPAIAAANEPGDAAQGAAAHAGQADSLPVHETANRAGETDPESRPASPETLDVVSSRSLAVAQAVATPAAELPGCIGRYEIRRLLGRGGMGAVYLAHDPELDRPVALKVPKLAGADAEERFLREARAAAAVTHPNLCPVYDAGRADGVLYLAMAYVPGSTLTETLREKGPLSSAEGAAIAAGVARGMAEAHRHGIVHRDLKPGNILLDRKGEPVVTDFGLALRASMPKLGADPALTVDHDPRLTHSGVLMGTPAYMPPEQARGDLDRIGPACDVYSLGAILFELLTGRLPFQTGPLFEMVRQIESQPAPLPSTIRRGVPAGLDAVCRRALAKDPADRFASMDAFAAALAPFASSSAWRRWRRVVAVAAACVLLACATIVFYIATDNGSVEVRLSDPAADVKVSVDGNEIRLTEGGRVTKLRAGPHGLEVTGDGFQTETRLFKVTRGDKTVVEIELKLIPKAADVSKPGQAAPPPDRARLAKLLTTGRQLIQQGRFGDLGPVADDALKLDAKSPGALALRATFRASRNETGGAGEDVEAALKLNPETYRALYVRGFLNWQAGYFDESIADLTAALRLEPEDPAAYVTRSSAYLRKGEFAQAIADANLALKLGATREHVYVNRGAAYACLGDYVKALADFDKAESIAPFNLVVLVQRSAVHAKAGNAAKAAADWAAARKQDPSLTDESRQTIPDPPKPVVRKKLTAAEAAEVARLLKEAEVAHAQGRFVDCRSLLDKAVQVDPTSGVVRAWRARAINDQPPEEAAAESTEALRLDPELASPYISRGLARISQKMPAAGIADLSVAITRDPTIPFAWNNRGWGYMHRKQYHQALADLNEAIRLTADEPVFYLNRGWCYVHLGEFEKALADHEASIRLQPRNARARMYCAAIKARLGDLDGARKEREAANSIDEKLKDAVDVILPNPLPPVKKDPELPAAAVADPGPPQVDRAKLGRVLARARKMLDDGKIAEMGNAADEALKIDATSPSALALRATFRLDQNELEGARDDAEASLKLNPETREALIVRATVSAEDGKFDEAIADETIAIRLDPQHPRGWANRAKSYLDRKDYRQAVADATRAIDLQLGAPDALLCRGGAYAFLGDYKKALADYDAAAKLAPNNWRVYDQRSALHAKMGNAAKEAEDWANASKLEKTLRIEERVVFPDPPKLPERKKLSPEQAREFTAALQTARQAFSQDRFEDCRKAAEEAVRIDPTSAAARAMRAQGWVNQGRHQEAIEEANEALRLNPNEDHAYLERGLARSRLKDSAGAIADYTIALRLSPTYSIAWNNRGFAFMDRGQYHQAIADLDAAIRLRPNYVNALTNRGMCYLHLAEYEKALADYETATKLQPTNARWWRVLALVRARLGDPEGARRDQERAVALDPQLANAPNRNLPVPLPPVKKDLE